MFKLLKNHQIDKEKWDHCVSYSSENIIYALSWYLDIVSPGWSALVHQQNENYISVMPLTIKRKFGIPYIAQPFFTQQLGFFSLRDDKEYMRHALNFLKRKFFLIDYNFNTFNTDVLEKSSLASFMASRINYVLHLSRPYQQIVENYSVNHKRNIKKASRNCLYVKRSDDFMAIINLFRKMKGEEVSEIKDSHYQNLHNIYEACRSRGYETLYVTIDKHGNVLAGGLFLVFQKRIIYLFGATTAEGRDTGAMTLIFDEIIKDYAGGDYFLDFEGGEMEGIGRFYKGFGGITVNYMKLYHSRIPLLKRKYDKDLNRK